MFKRLSEDTLQKIYDWIPNMYVLSPPPNNHDNRQRAICALNDMRSLYAGVGNNGWWDTDRIYNLENLRDIIPYSMNEALWQNELLHRYEQRKRTAREKYEDREGWDAWGDDEDWIFYKKYAPDILKMQGNKDGKLYKYTKELFWNSVEWFLNYYSTEQQRKHVAAIIKQN